MNQSKMAMIIMISISYNAAQYFMVYFYLSITSCWKLLTRKNKNEMSLNISLKRNFKWQLCCKVKEIQFTV